MTLDALVLFPYHRVPDGSVGLPHHFTYALLLSLVPILAAWDVYPHREPAGVLTGVVVALIGFMLVWPRYPVTGAVGTLTGLAAASAFWLYRVVHKPERWRWWPLVLVGLCLLVAWDDALQHSLGWQTPLDYIWKNGGRALLPSV